MARKATGEVRQGSDGMWRAVVRVAGRRRSYPLPHAQQRPQAAERAEALAQAATAMGRCCVAAERQHVALQHLAAASEQVMPDLLDAVYTDVCGGRVRPKRLEGVKPTFREIGQQWTSGELHRLYPDRVPLKKSTRADASILDTYIYPVIGDSPIDKVTLDDCERVLSRLPPTLAGGTRRQIALRMTRLFNLAVFPLGHIKHSPLPKGWIPGGGKRRLKTFLYPSEDRALLACTAVPLVYRLLWGFLAREGLRSKSEALALTWGQLDLERGSVRLERTKTGQGRIWALGPAVTRALRAYREHHCPQAGQGELVFRLADGRPIPHPNLALTLRDHLQLAGVKRSELFESNADRQQLRAHDLRATFITVALANGRSEAWIADRTGHCSSAQINGYRRQARTFSELGLGELDALDKAIPELRDCHSLPLQGANHVESLKRIHTVRSDAEAQNAEKPGGLPPAQPLETPHAGSQWQSSGNQDPIETWLRQRVAAAVLAGDAAAEREARGMLEARLAEQSNVVVLDLERARRGRA